MDKYPDITREMKRAELRLEIEMRHKVYRRRVNNKSMSHAVASRKIRIMNAILDDYADQPGLFETQGTTKK